MEYSNIKDISELVKTASTEVTEEMLDFYDKRTNKHIDRVRKYCKKIDELGLEEFSGIIDRGKEHDKSKLTNPEKDPYVYITWEYKCKDEGKTCNFPKELRDKMNDATKHHVSYNAHHPEYHDKSKGDEFINREDRDAIPSKMVDATKMSDLDVAEMVADWCAMSEEKGGNPEDWAKKNINKRWKFTKEQEELIYDLIDYAWE